MTPPQPLYDPHRAEAAYHLRDSWTGFPSGRAFASTPVDLLPTIAPLWEQDGLRLLEFRWTRDLVQLLFSATPKASPAHLAQRAKGRLSYALRQAGLTMPLSRKLAVRSIGDNTREEVERYIERQVGKERFADTRFAQHMRGFAIVNRDVDLSLPSASARGRYWYNLHLVFVVEGRSAVADLQTLATIRDKALEIAAKKGHAIVRLLVMPDHLHVALRGVPSESPADLVFTYQNNLAYALGQKRMWRDSYYAGTFSEYTMDAVRRLADRSSDVTTAR